MKVYKPIGSKDRLFEMFQNVNKVKINEGLYEAGSPNLNADNVLNMAFNQLKNNGLNIEHSNTQATGEENFVELMCTDKQGNNITFVFKVQSTEGDQEGVFNVNGVILNSFSYDSADGEETIDLAEDGLKNFNQQHSREFFDVIDKYVDVEEPAENEVQEAIDLIDAIKQDSYPFGGGDDRMQTGKNYGDEKPTNDAVRVKAPELDKFIQESNMNTSFIYTLSSALKELGIQLLNVIDKPKIDTLLLKLKYGGKLYDAPINKEDINSEDINSVDNVMEILKNKIGINGVSEIMQTGKNYGDEKPTNDAVRVNAPELDKFVQEDMTLPIKIKTKDELKAYIEKKKTSGRKFGQEDIPLLAGEALYHIAVKIADGMLPMGWDGLADVNSMWDYIRKDGGMSLDQLRGAVKRAVNIRLKEEGMSLRDLGLGENLQELDQPAMKLIQQAPGGATAGGVKQLEEVDVVGEPKPINPSTKSPVDDLPPEKKKVIMDAINSLTKHKPDFAPSANEINNEILRMRNQPPAVKENWEDDILQKGQKEFEKRVSDPVVMDQPVDLSQASVEDEPIPDVSPEKRRIILQAGDNLMEKNARNPNYSPTMNEIMDEIDKIEGKVKPLKKFRSVSKEAEPYLAEITQNISPAEIAAKGTEQIFDKIDPNSNIKSQIIRGASEFADMHLGVKRFQMSPEEYKKFVKNVALTMYVDYMGYTRQNEETNLNEDDEKEKGQYPDPMGKKFKPKTHYPKKKKKGDSIVKLSEEETYTDDDEPVLPVDTAAKRAQMQAKSDISKDLGGDAKRPIGNYDTKFQFDMAEDLSGKQPSTGEELLKKEYENLKQNETFEFLSDAYVSLLGLDREFRDDKKIQVSLANIRDSIVEYCNMAEVPVTQQGVQDFFENNLEESLYEDKEPGAEIPETDPDKTGPDVVSEPSVGSMEKLPDDGTSLEPQGDEIAQLAQDKEEQGEILQGGKGDGKSPLEFDPEQILMGLEVEKEHSDDSLIAIEVVMDHLTEDPEYYTQKDTPEASAQAGASADASGEEKSDVEKENPDLYPDGWKEMDGMFMNPNSPLHKGMQKQDDDKEMTDKLLGFKPHNVGDEVEVEPDKKEDELGESTTTSVSDMGSRFESIANAPRPETAMVKEDLGYSEKELKDRDPATWHQIQIAKKTLKMPDQMVAVMGGMTKEEAKEILRKHSVKGIQEIVAGKKSKAFRIGEWAIGGIIKVDVNGPMIRIEALDFNTKRPVKGEDFSKDDINGMDNYLNELTSSFYAGKVMEWIQASV
jgi:hypothetical protein